MARGKPRSSKGLLRSAIGRSFIADWALLAMCFSGLFPPAPMLVRLPVGCFKAFCPGFGPMGACCYHRFFIVAVKHEHNAVIVFRVGGHWSAIDEETHGCAVRVAFIGG